SRAGGRPAPGAGRAPHDRAAHLCPHRPPAVRARGAGAGSLSVSVESAAAAAGAIRDFQDTFAAVRREMARLIVGHDAVIDTILVGLFAGGHVLIEGVPGTGKTLILRSLPAAPALPFTPIPF